MFKTNFMKCLGSNVNYLSGVRRMCSTKPKVEIVKSENTTVRICGEIVETPIVTSNNNIGLRVRTRTNEKRYEVHNLFISNRNLLRRYSECLGEGNRIYAEGLLNHVRVQTVDSDGQEKFVLKQTSIIPTQFYMIKQNEAITPENSDINTVRMTGTVHTEAEDTENVTFLGIKSNYWIREDGIVKKKHKLFSFSTEDPKLRLMFRELKEHQLVEISGALSYHQKTHNGINTRNLKIKADQLTLLKSDWKE